MGVETSRRLPSVVLTGASTGIGAACAVALDRRGFRVFAGVRSDADGERLKRETSARLVPLRLDVTDARQIAEAARHVGEAVGPGGLDGLVNNAGIVVAGPWELLAIEELRKQLEVNVIGPAAVTQALLPLLRTARGRIVLMGSVSGKVAAPYLGPYAVSKYGLEAMADSLRVELRHWGIAVSLVEPGSVKTPIWDKATEQAEQLSARVPTEAWTLYAEDMEQMRHATKALAARGMPVARVVEAVEHALTARKPKTRYPLGLQTRLAVSVFQLVADRTRDWIVRRELGLR